MTVKSAAPGDRLPLSTILAFSATSLPLAAVGIAIGVYLPRHYAAHIGIDLAAVGAAFAIIRLIDIPLDPLLGVAMDRTRTRFGRYRVWTLIGVPVVMLSTWMLFLPPESAGRFHLMAWLLVMYLGTSILGLSHVAWAARLATSYNERSRIFGVLAAVGVAGSSIALLMPMLMEQLGYDSSAAGVMAMGILAVALTPICAGFVVWRTPETVAPDHGHKQVTLKDYVSLVARPTMGRIVIADLCLALGPGWMSALYLFYFTEGRDFTTGQASLLLLVYVLAGFAGAPLMARLATRISKHRAVMVTTTLYAAGLAALLVLPRGDMVWGALQMFYAGFLAAGFTVLTRAMTADAADEIRLEQGRERSGLLFAMTTLTNKIAGAFSIFLTFTVLSQIGYQAREGATNTPEAIQALEYAFLIGPIFFVLVGGFCFIGYKLGADRHADIRRQLDERDALYAEAAIIESVTTEVTIEPNQGEFDRRPKDLKPS